MAERGSIVAGGRPEHRAARPGDHHPLPAAGNPVQPARRRHAPLAAAPRRPHADRADNAGRRVHDAARAHHGIHRGGRPGAGAVRPDDEDQLMAVAVRTTTAWRWPATGTTWQVHHSGGVDTALAGEAAAAVAADEARWSRFAATSDVARVTAGAGGPVRVGPETIDLVAAAVRWTRATGGVFSPLVGRALAEWGYADSLLARRPGCALSPVAAPVRGEPVIDPAAGTIAIPPGTALDLGGIGKGWMARRLGAMLAARCDDPLLLVDAGGDLAAVRGEHLV